MSDTTLGNNTNDPTLNFFNLPPPSQLEGGTKVDPNQIGPLGHKGNNFDPGEVGPSGNKGSVVQGTAVDTTQAVEPDFEQIAKGTIALGGAVGGVFAALYKTQNLDAQAPTLPTLQAPNMSVDQAIQNLGEVLKANPWLAGSPLTAIWAAMSECMDMTRDMGYVEAMLRVTEMNESFLLAQGSAELTLLKGEQEFQQNILKAVITAAVGVATCVISVYTPAMMGLNGGGATAMSAGKVVGGMELLKAFGNSLGNLVDAFYAREIAETEAQKIIKDAVKQAIDRLIDDLGSSVKDNQAFFDQLAQKLTDIISQIKKAFEKQG